MGDDDLNVRFAELRVRYENLDRRVTALENGNKWIILAIMGAVIGTILQKIGLG